MKLVATIFSHSIRAHANHLSTIQSQDLSIHLHRPLPFSLLHTKIQILGQGIPPCDSTGAVGIKVLAGMNSSTVSETFTN